MTLTKRHYDFIVLGCGGIGSGTAYWLARSGKGSVLALEQFDLGHHNGGSQDHSRIIRLTYHHENYTRLTPHTYTAWQTLEEESGVHVVHKTGSVEVVRLDSPHLHEIDVYRAAMDAASIPYEVWDGEQTMRRYPQFRFKDEVKVVYQEDTGLADAIKGNAAHVAMARYYGATVLSRTRAVSVVPLDGGVAVTTPQGTFTGGKLIVTAGAWTDKVLASVGVNVGVTVTQEQVTYYATSHLKQFAIGRFPIFIWHGDQVIYGFPVYGEVATKAAIDAAGPVVSADTRTYDADPVRERIVEDWLQEYIPDFLGPKLYTKTCLYDMPRDRNFIIDALPDLPQILVCSGAGHAYKFASLLGKIISELAIDGQTQYPIAPFNIRREAVVDPNYPPVFHI